MRNSQFHCKMNLEGYLLRVKDLILIEDPVQVSLGQTSTNPLLSSTLVETLKSYCLWSHPIEQQYSEGIETLINQQDSLNNEQEIVSFNNIETPSLTTQIMIKHEITYLEKTLKQLIEDFKQQFTTLVQMHEQEFKDFQRSFAYSRKGAEKSNYSQMIIDLRNYHKSELDNLKMRQFSIISFVRSALSGIQQTYNDILDGKLDTYCFEKCAKCKRIIRIIRQNQVLLEEEKMINKDQHSSVENNQVKNAGLSNEIKKLFKNHKEQQKSLIEMSSPRLASSKERIIGGDRPTSQNYEASKENQSQQITTNKFQQNESGIFSRKSRLEGFAENIKIADLSSSQQRKSDIDTLFSTDENNDQKNEDLGKTTVKHQYMRKRPQQNNPLSNDQNQFLNPLAPLLRSKQTGTPINEQPILGSTGMKNFNKLPSLKRDNEVVNTSTDPQSSSNDIKSTQNQKKSETIMPNLQKIIQDLTQKGSKDGTSFPEDMVYKRQNKDLADREHLRGPQAHRIRKIPNKNQYQSSKRVNEEPLKEQLPENFSSYDINKSVEMKGNHPSQERLKIDTSSQLGAPASRLGATQSSFNNGLKTTTKFDSKIIDSPRISNQEKELSNNEQTISSNPKLKPISRATSRAQNNNINQQLHSQNSEAESPQIQKIKQGINSSTNINANRQQARSTERLAAQEQQSPSQQSYENLNMTAAGSQTGKQDKQIKQPLNQFQHNYMQSSAQGRARSTMRMGQPLNKEKRDIDQILKDAFKVKFQQQNSKPSTDQKEETDQQHFYKQYNYYKNDLSFLEPQKPVNLPDIKLNKQQQQSIIEQSMKQQSMWSNNMQQQTSGQGKQQSQAKTERPPQGGISDTFAQSQQQQQQQFQFNYYSDRKQSMPGSSKIPHNNTSQQRQQEEKAQNNNQTQSNFYTNQNAYSGNPTSEQNNANKEPPNRSFLNTHSRDGMRDQQQQQQQRAQQPNNNTQQKQNDSQKLHEHIKSANAASKYTNIKEEKAKVTKLLEEFEKKQRLERELRMQQKQQSQASDDMVFKSGAKEKGVFETQTPEQVDYVKELLQVKPWLSCLPLRASKLEYLKKTFPLNEETSSQILNLSGKDLDDFKAEMEYVSAEVVQKRNMQREKKNDYELLMDARYFNKYGDYLLKRLESKSYYGRLEVPKEASKAEIKKSYFKLALIWHPDNIKKKYRFGFAHEQVFTKLVAQIFVLFEEAYKNLSNDESRQIYDLKSGNLR